MRSHCPAPARTARHPRWRTQEPFALPARFGHTATHTRASPWAIEQAEKQHVLDTRQTDRLLTRHPNHPGARRLRAALATAYPHIDTRSDNEALLTTLCHQAGLPLPQTNVALTLNRRNVTVDALWPRHRLIVEVDNHTITPPAPR